MPHHPAFDDRANLDAQYNNRALVPNHVQLYKNWAPLSAKVFDDYKFHKDVVYGPSPRELIDIILPEGKGPHPVMIYIHGGYWMSREKSDQTFIAPAFADAGIAFALIEYDLMPKVTMSDIVTQCQSAAIFIHRHADIYNLDSSKIFISGHSAGGHLTAILASTDWSRFDCPQDMLKGGCALSGIYDLSPVRHTYIQEVIGLTDRDVAEYSPLNFKNKASIPLVVAAGGSESEAFRHQSRGLVNAWNKDSSTCTYIEPTGLNHFTILSEYSNADSDLTQDTITMIKNMS